MKTVFGIAFMGIGMLFSACNDDVQGTSGNDQKGSELQDPSVIQINEYCFKKNLESELGSKSDWIELYNNSSEDVTLVAGDWSITDKKEEIDKYYIPELTIYGRSHLILFCDGEDIQDDEIHTNFKLSSKGETIGLYYKGELVDEHSYDSTQVNFQCNCRNKDGIGEWKGTNDPTPGKPNQ